jgi:spoIIIJ-associated protein
VKDRVFSGRDVADALAAAGQALGLPPEALRYVVLEAGRAGGLGVGATPARIAVLLDGSPAPASREPAPAPARPSGDPRAGIRAVIRALGEAAGIDLAAEVEEGEQGLRVHLGGKDRGFFLEEGCEVLRATEHLLMRMFARDVAPRGIHLECEGYREQREEALRATALELAAAVAADGKPRESPPLNSYERRIVHLALAEVKGVVTYSVGEGGDRRVTVAPAGAASLPPGGEP